VETLHGEPAATCAFITFFASGVLTSITVVTLGSSTEALSAEALLEDVSDTATQLPSDTAGAITFYGRRK
jgi:hypothetical protein